jgi:hypothetical protein
MYPKDNKIDQKLIEGVTQIANVRIQKDFPLLGDKYFKSSEVRYIVESLASLMLVYKRSKNV